MILFPALLVFGSVAFSAAAAKAQQRVYNAHIVAGGPPLTKPTSSEVQAAHDRTLLVWFRPAEGLTGRSTAVAVGDGTGALQLGLDDGHPAVHAGAIQIVAEASSNKGWRQMAAVVPRTPPADVC